MNYRKTLIIIILLLETLISDPRDISGSNITLDSDGYISGETFQNIVFNLYVTTSDTENVDFFSLTFSTGFTLNSGSESDGEYPTINGNTISWGQNNNNGWGWWWGTNDYSFSVNVNVDASVSGGQEIDYHISGDQYEGSSTPHDINSSLTIQQLLPDLVITSIDITPNAQYDFDNITFEVNVQNNGNATSANAYVSIWFNETDPNSINHEQMELYSLYPGMTDAVTFSVYFDYSEHILGENIIYACLDCPGTVDESNENNNTEGPETFTWIEGSVTGYYTWPISDIYQSHRLSGMVNEYREFDRLHQGVDIPASGG